MSKLRLGLVEDHFVVRFSEYTEFGLRNTLCGAPHSPNWHEFCKIRQIWHTNWVFLTLFELILCDCEHLNTGNNTIVHD